jgi:hypothetical protein
MRSLIIISTLVLTGCAFSQQSFKDISYDEGLVTRKVVGKSITVAPPFGSRAIAEHSLYMDESPEGWNIQTGSRDDLSGGNLTPDMIDAIRAIMAVPGW